MRTRTLAVLALGLAATSVAATSLAAALDSDGTHLRAGWTNGGSLEIELEDRNVEPMICFLWDNPAPQDGDGFASRILTRAGAEVVDLGTADQWIDGAGEGCEIPRDERFREVFSRPGDHIVELQVVEDQGTAATPPIRSLPLEPASSG